MNLITRRRKGNSTNQSGAKKTQESSHTFSHHLLVEVLGVEFLGAFLPEQVDTESAAVQRLLNELPKKKRQKEGAMF